VLSPEISAILLVFLFSLIFLCSVWYREVPIITLIVGSMSSDFASDHNFIFIFLQIYLHALGKRNADCASKSPSTSPKFSGGSTTRAEPDLNPN